MTSQTSSDLHGVLVVDKGKGPTSHDVVARARRALGTKAIGHTGTLDPMATGVLVLAIGEATKLVSMLGATHKSYEATLALGRATTTLDAEGELVEERAVPALTLDRVCEAAAAFVGEIDQQVPAVSAVKVGGQALHKLARKGREVEAPVRRVQVHALDVRALRGHEVDFSVRASKGFYVRSLARDLAAALGTVGHLSALRRTENGPFVLRDAVDFELVAQAGRGTDAERAALRARVIPLVQLCESLPHTMLGDESARLARHGRTISTADTEGARDLGDGELCVALAGSAGGARTPIAIVQRSGDLFRVVRGFHGL